jgi:TrkA domain protein
VIIERTPLPGIGMCHTAVTARRQRLGVVCHRAGRRDLILYHPDDPQHAAYAVVLDPAEARHLAEMLTATIAVDHIADPQQYSLAVAGVRVATDSAYHALPLSELYAQWRVDVRLIAVIRGRRVTTDPTGEFVVYQGDTLLVAGENAAITALAELVGDADHPWRRTGDPKLRRRRPHTTAPPRKDQRG